MVIFYADNEWNDIGVLKGFKADFEASTIAENNTFEVQADIGNPMLQPQYWIYMENTEYGGIVDKQRINTQQDTVYYEGRTWRGILASKIIQPQSGQDYYTIQGYSEIGLRLFLRRNALENIFEWNISSPPSLNSFQFPRYIDLYSGLMMWFAENGHKLIFNFNSVTKKCELDIVPIVNYADQMEISNDFFDFDITKTENVCNHLIGLGQGELKNREVFHAYADANGIVSETQTLTDEKEVVQIYDYPSVQDYEELKTATKKKLKEMQAEDIIKITPQNIDADLGDKFVAKEQFTGLTVEQTVDNKITTIDDDKVVSNYTAKNNNKTSEVIA